MNEEILKTLKLIGLTEQETKAYLALLELQEAKTGTLCKQTSIASSNIYTILEKLLKKGLISYRLQNNIKIFMPGNPEVLNELFEEKVRLIKEEKSKINKIVKQLKTKPIINPPQSGYKYFEGINGIKSMWHEINANLNKSSNEYIFAAKKEAFEKLISFYDEHHKTRNRLKAKAKIILPTNAKALAKKRENKNTKTKIMNLKNEAEWGVVDDFEYLQHISTNKPRGFLIKDGIFAETLKQAFNEIWKS